MSHASTFVLEYGGGRVFRLRDAVEEGEPMSFVTARVIQAAIAAAVFETVIYAYPFHPFYLLPVVMFTVLETLLYLVIICVAAFIATRFPASASWAQKCVFFVLVIAPSLYSYFSFQGFSFYSLGGRSLVVDHRITTAGFEHLLTNLGIHALLALVAVLIYFRGNSQPSEARASP
jgi:hypothetical protein